jgi:hypothetical protein
MAPTLDIARQRLHNQRLLGPRFARPEDAVRWLGAVQSQDYAGAKWALAQRTEGATDAALDDLFAAGAILRTHVLRPTWHFVLPEDIRWLLALTAPRVHTANAHYYRRLELDDALLRRGDALLAAALQGGKHLTRPELAAALRAGGIEAGGPRLGYLLMHAELEALICSGPRRGKQFTYALLAERAPDARTLDRDEALAELTGRFFASHGPATPHDFAWWSGLTVTEARTGIELAKPRLAQETLDGKTYWFAPPATTAPAESPVVHLLPNYDEHIVAYKDHGPSLDPAIRPRLVPDTPALLAHLVAVDGLVVGGWRRTIQRNEAVIETDLLRPLSNTEQAALGAAADGYGRFLGLPARLSLS